MYCPDCLEQDQVCAKCRGVTPAAPPAEQLNAAGNRMNVGKPRWSLLMRHMSGALAEVVRVTEHGAAKYGPHGWWKNPLDLEETLDSAQRHVLALMRGEAHDADSGLPHWAHAAWNMLAYGALALLRPAPPTAAEGDRLDRLAGLYGTERRPRESDAELRARLREIARRPPAPPSEAELQALRGEGSDGR